MNRRALTQANIRRTLAHAFRGAFIIFGPSIMASIPKVVYLVHPRFKGNNFGRMAKVERVMRARFGKKHVQVIVLIDDGKILPRGPQ